jgi:hypothetical protein
MLPGKCVDIYLFWCLHLHAARKVCGHVFVLVSAPTCSQESVIRVFVLVSAPTCSQESVWSCICLFGCVDLSSVSDFDILFWNCSDSVVYFVPTELFRQFGILCSY